MYLEVIMGMFNVLVIGNGYDLSLGLDTKFSSFMETQINEEYVLHFFEENKNYFIKRDFWDPYYGSIVTVYRDFSSIFLDINSWNDIEHLIDSVYEYQGFNNYEYVEANGISIFMQKFSEMFEIWIETKVLEEKPDYINHIETYTDDDIIINLNFTNTIPEKYKNVKQVHRISGNYHYIGPSSIKNVHEDIVNNIDELEAEIKGYVGAVYLFGVNMHDINVVDKHIINLLNNIASENQNNIPLNYINLNIEGKEKKRLSERFSGYNDINFIDSISGTKSKITNPYHLPF